MKTLKLTAFILLISIQLMAQVKISLKLGGGGAMPLSPSNLKDNWKVGLGGGAGLDIALPGSIVIEGEVDYFKYAVDSDKLVKSYGGGTTGISVSGGAISMLSVTGNLKLFLIPKISPVTIYLFGGGGLTSMTAEDTKISYMSVSQTVSGTTESKPCAQAGGGIQISLGSTGLFAEAKYLSIFTKDNTTASAVVKAGLIFSL